MYKLEGRTREFIWICIKKWAGSCCFYTLDFAVGWSRALEDMICNIFDQYLFRGLIYP